MTNYYGKEVPNLFGGPLTVELMKEYIRKFKAIPLADVMFSPVIIPARLYDDLKAAGGKLDDYVRQEPIPR